MLDWMSIKSNLSDVKISISLDGVTWILPEMLVSREWKNILNDDLCQLRG